jgi:hypothetical protein
LLKPKGLQLKHLWRDAAPKLDFVDTERMNVYILQVMSILRQTYCSPKYLYYLLPRQEKKVREPDGSLRKEILVPNVVEFEKRWHQAVDALERAIDRRANAQEVRQANRAMRHPTVSSNREHGFKHDFRHRGHLLRVGD